MVVLATIPQVLLPLNSFAQEAEEGLTKEASWKWPDLRLFDEQFKSYLDLVQPAESKKQQALESWVNRDQNAHGPEVLDRLLESSAVIDPRVEQLLAKLNRNQDNNSAESFDLSWFDAKVPGWLQDNIKLAVGRYLSQHSLYEESLQVLDSVEERSVVDPSSWMFYRAICLHHLLEKDKCTEMIDRLLQRESEIVSRYVVTAKLMQSDISPLKKDSLDEIARMMTAVEKKLELGRAGSKVREQEKEIVDKLDKLIDKIEQQLQEQQKQQQQQQQQQNSKPQQGKPAEESQAGGISGPGDVNQKKLEDKGGWGDLPPAQRQEALQNITRDLPSHFREVIEAYFKRLGSGDSEK